MKIFFTKNTWFERFFGRNGGRPLPPKKIRQIVFPQVKLIKVININTLLSSQFLNSQPQDQASWPSRQICGSRDCLGCKVSGAHIHFRFVFRWKCFLNDLMELKVSVHYFYRHGRHDVGHTTGWGGTFDWWWYALLSRVKQGKWKHNPLQEINMED